MFYCEEKWDTWRWDTQARVKAPNQAAADFTDRNQAVSFTLHGFAAE